MYAALVFDTQVFPATAPLSLGQVRNQENTTSKALMTTRRSSRPYWQATCFVFTIEFPSGMKPKIWYLRREDRKKKSKLTSILKYATRAECVTSSRRFDAKTYCESQKADSQGFNGQFNITNNSVLNEIAPLFFAENIQSRGDLEIQDCKQFLSIT